MLGSTLPERHGTLLPSVVKCRNCTKITVLIRQVALIFKFNCRLLANEKTIHQIMSTMYSNVL